MDVAFINLSLIKDKVYLYYIIIIAFIVNYRKRGQINCSMLVIKEIIFFIRNILNIKKR
jgi:hypothetical protein